MNSSNETLSLAEILKKYDLNLSSNPKGTDKGDLKSYVAGFYEPEFRARRGKKNRLLEVGVRSGASLALWANYFNNAEILGLDIEAAGSNVGPLEKYLDFPSVRFFCMDAYDPAIAQSFQGSFSILIDDGPHSLSSQKKFIELYLSKLDKDGVLIIEDIQGGFVHCFELMRMLPKEFTFEVYDFRRRGFGDDMLFVVRSRAGFFGDFFRMIILSMQWFGIRVYESIKYRLKRLNIK